jgi:hypothetical protein
MRMPVENIARHDDSNEDAPRKIISGFPPKLANFALPAASIGITTEATQA